MQKVNVLKLVIEAQKQLIRNPFDLAHDITHHYRVQEEALKIIEEENLAVDEDLMIICAWYHDLGGRRGENSRLLSSLIGKYIEDRQLINRIIQIIREHSYGEAQTSLESKVLFDADKLEYVNPMRLRWFLKAFREGYITSEVYSQYKREWKERIKDAEGQLHFSYTKQKFSKMLPVASQLMKD
jgi:HD superfamily phosphodiesterase